MNTIAILHSEGGNLGLNRLGRVGWLGLQGYRLALLVGVDAFNRDVVQCRRDGGSAGVVQHVFQCRASFKFINRRPLDHAEDGNLRASGRDQQRIAGLQTLVIHAHAVQQKAVQVDFSYQLLSAIMAHDAQRPDAGRSAGLINGVERSGEGTDVVSSRTLHVADDIHPHRAQAGNGHIDLGVVVLLLERAFDAGPGLLQGESRYNKRPRFRERDLTLTIDDAGDVL